MLQNPYKTHTGIRKAHTQAQNKRDEDTKEKSLKPLCRKGFRL